MNDYGTKDSTGLFSSHSSRRIRHSFVTASQRMVCHPSRARDIVSVRCQSQFERKQDKALKVKNVRLSTLIRVAREHDHEWPCEARRGKELLHLSRICISGCGEIILLLSSQLSWKVRLMRSILKKRQTSHVDWFLRDRSVGSPRVAE